MSKRTLNVIGAAFLAALLVFLYAALGTRTSDFRSECQGGITVLGHSASCRTADGVMRWIEP